MLKDFPKVRMLNDFAVGTVPQRSEDECRFFLLIPRTSSSASCYRRPFSCRSLMCVCLLSFGSSLIVCGCFFGVVCWHPARCRRQRVVATEEHSARVRFSGCVSPPLLVAPHVLETCCFLLCFNPRCWTRLDNSRRCSCWVRSMSARPASYFLQE